MQCLLFSKNYVLRRENALWWTYLKTVDHGSWNLLLVPNGLPSRKSVGYKKHKNHLILWCPHKELLATSFIFKLFFLAYDLMMHWIVPMNNDVKKYDFPKENICFWIIYDTELLILSYISLCSWSRISCYFWSMKL